MDRESVQYMIDVRQSKYQLVSCPYNSSHKVRKDRQAQHLTKCSAQHPLVKLEVCPYNALHRFPAKDRVDHLKNCINRSSIDQQTRAVAGHHQDIDDDGRAIQHENVAKLPQHLERMQLRRPKCAQSLGAGGSSAEEKRCPIQDYNSRDIFKWPASVPKTVWCYPVDKRTLSTIPERKPLRRPKLIDRHVTWPMINCLRLLSLWDRKKTVKWCDNWKWHLRPCALKMRRVFFLMGKANNTNKYLVLSTNTKS